MRPSTVSGGECGSGPGRGGEGAVRAGWRATGVDAVRLEQFGAAGPRGAWRREAGAVGLQGWLAGEPGRASGGRAAALGAERCRAPRLGLAARAASLLLLLPPVRGVPGLGPRTPLSSVRHVISCANKMVVTAGREGAAAAAAAAASSSQPGRAPGLVLAWD